MEARYVVIPVSAERGYILDTKTGKRIGSDMILHRATEQARSLNQVNEIFGKDK